MTETADTDPVGTQDLVELTSACVECEQADATIGNLCRRCAGNPDAIVVVER